MFEKATDEATWFNRCQEDFERGWVMKGAIAAAASIKALDDEAAKAANVKTKESGASA